MVDTETAVSADDDAPKEREWRVLVVDDHPMSRRGLISLLDSERGFRVCGEAADPAQARTSLAQCAPDLALIDLSLGRGSGLELVADVARLAPDCRILVVSMHEERIYAERSLRAGADGYIGKSEAADRMLGAIRTVLAGEIYLSPEWAGHVLQRAFRSRGRAAGPGRPEDVLSNRELEVFALMGEGLSMRQIAERLERSVKTIESHRERMRQKLGDIDTSTLVRQAVAWYVETHGGNP